MNTQPLPTPPHHKGTKDTNFCPWTSSGHPELVEECGYVVTAPLRYRLGPGALSVRQNRPRGSSVTQRQQVEACLAAWGTTASARPAESGRTIPALMGVGLSPGGPTIWPTTAHTIHRGHTVLCGERMGSQSVACGRANQRPSARRRRVRRRRTASASNPWPSR